MEIFHSYVSLAEGKTANQRIWNTLAWVDSTLADSSKAWGMSLTNESFSNGNTALKQKIGRREPTKLKVEFEAAELALGQQK